MLEAHLSVQRGEFSLDVALSVGTGEVVALLGPNGAGKSTALRALAGLLRLDSGSIVVDGAVWDGPGAFVPAPRRRIGVVFQDYLLFPHLSAEDNVAFGPRSHGIGKVEARSVAREWLARVGLEHAAGEKPRRLSGGQAQRVALARALAVEPRLLLLDEPLAALDAATRQELRAELRRHLADPGASRATLLVTHDPLDAMVLADRIIVIEGGRIVQEGTATEITRSPRTDYVARLVGLNLYRGTGAGTLVKLDDALTLSTVDSVDGPAFVAFAPSAVALFRSRPEGSPRNTWPAVVSGIERHADMVRVRIDGPVSAAADVTSAAVAELGLDIGAQVWAAVKATETHAYAA